MNSNILLISTLSAFLLTACDDDPTEPEPNNIIEQNIIEQNQKKWTDSNIST